MLQTISSFFPLLYMLLDLIVMIICLRKIANQAYFSYFNRTIWMGIVVLGGILGQLLYWLMENNQQYKQ